MAAHIPQGPGEALDFGTGGSALGLLAAKKGFNVISVDLLSQQLPYKHPSLRYLQGDILKLDLPVKHFDIVINCSTVEHVGLVGRYNVVEERYEGDLEAMAKLMNLMKPNGVMLLTIPVGIDRIIHPLHRIYGKKRLPLLLNGFIIESKAYWIKDVDNKWISVSENESLNNEYEEGLFGLGCFVLRSNKVD